VPSNWEQHGFGTYNYGHDKDSVRGKEEGKYRYHFQVPKEWQGKYIEIVFLGSMTDTKVKINCKSAGAMHQGSFYRFSYPISDLLNYGKENLLEVSVAKHSTNESINRAERYADFWIFGGIFRPVFLEVSPAEHIGNIRVDARADGSFKAEAKIYTRKKGGIVKVEIFDGTGASVGVTQKNIPGTGASIIQMEMNMENIQTWSPEFPNLYTAKFTLYNGEKQLHSKSETIGFRTVELRERDGFYLNGQKIKFKGVNRHSFRPETARSLSREDCIEDATLIREMNMNAVRNSHYPADEYFLDACDSLGIMVMDELTGWHDAYDTQAGTILATELLTSNQHHPSIVIWANGNEGGHNPELDPVFDALDFQKRPVCHPWINFRGMDTQHYINYDYGLSTHFHGHDVVFATEFLHGLYDGGHGAGLRDYWEYMWDLPLSAGGFLWDFADGGIMRSDKDGQIDTDGNHAADGILGPHHEKEGSFYTIREVWSPVYFEPKEITPAFDGTFNIENRYHFTNLDQCAFTYELQDWEGTGSDTPSKTKKGNIASPNLDPVTKGKLKMELPGDWKSYDVLNITATDPRGEEIFTWSWPLKLPDEVAAGLLEKTGDKLEILSETEDAVEIRGGDTRYTFDRTNGILTHVSNSRGNIPFGDGPRLSDGVAGFRGMEITESENEIRLSCSYSDESSFKTLTWTIYPSGWLGLSFDYRPSDYQFDLMGVDFSYPEELVTGARWMGDGPYRVWKNRTEGNMLSVHEKAYNNTITGKRDYIYPEFKGYHSNMYWVRILSREQDFVVATSSEDVFLRLFTPEFPDDPFNTAPAFPTGNISFMHGIPPIGTKSQVAENMGPSGKKNMYFDYWKQRSKHMELFFNFEVEEN